jgi:hypothetical protein
VNRTMDTTCSVIAIGFWAAIGCVAALEASGMGSIHDYDRGGAAGQKLIEA